MQGIEYLSRAHSCLSGAVPHKRIETCKIRWVRRRTLGRIDNWADQLHLEITSDFKLRPVTIFQRDVRILSGGRKLPQLGIAQMPVMRELQNSLLD